MDVTDIHRKVTSVGMSLQELSAVRRNYRVIIHVNYSGMGDELVNVLYCRKAGTEIQDPIVPLFANVTAAPVGDAGTIRKLLVDQVTGMVRWRESVIAMRDAGVTHFIELGGKVLVPMIKRIVEDVDSESIVEMSDIDSLLEAV